MQTNHQLINNQESQNLKITKKMKLIRYKNALLIQLTP
jgi:hypothetical protein